MADHSMFNRIRAGSTRRDPEVSNHQELGLAPEARGVHILWMYPDVLNMHGGRGDAMALLHYSDLLGLPCTIRRCDTLSQEIPFDWADMIFFPSGDLASMPDLCRALADRREDFRQFADQGRLVLAIGSSGALLAEQTVYLDGTAARGLGLLGMELSQRKTPFGDDLWLNTDDGPEILALQVQMADVTLLEGQAPLGQVRYGRGNCGDGREGARTGNVIFTHCLGPVLPKNPRLAEYLLTICAGIAGVETGTLSAEDIALELSSQEDVKAFIQKKISGQIS